MKQQSEKRGCEFVVQKACLRGPICNTTSYRIVNLQNKVTFYEGQLDPLQIENEALREDLLSISKIISSNTAILRKLLLVEQHPSRKLKLEMATFEQITQFIDQHCKNMEQQIAQLARANLSLEEERRVLHQELVDHQEERRKDRRLFQSERTSLTSHYEDKIRVLKQRLQEIQAQYQSTKSSLSEQLDTHKATIEKYMKEMHLQKTEFGFRERQLKACVERLRLSNQASSYEYEEGRKALKVLYQKMINDRLAEQGETYELMLNHKEEEKHRIYIMIDELKQAQLRLQRQRAEERQKMSSSLLVEREANKKLQDQLYEMREQFKQKGMEQKQTNRQLLILKENCQILENNCKKYEANIERIKIEHRIETDILQNKINELAKELSLLMDKTEQQKSELIKEISEKQALLSTQKVKLEDIDKTVKLQIREFKAQSELKQEQLKAALKEKEQRFKEEREKYERLQKEMQRDLKMLAERHQQAIKRLQKQHTKKREQLIKESLNKMQKIQEQKEDEIIRVKLENNQQIQALRGQFQQTKEKIKVEQVESSKKQVLELLRERTENHNRMQVLQNTLTDCREEISKLKKGMVMAEDKLEKLKAAQVKQIIKLDNKNNELNSKWQAIYDKQMVEFQQSFQEASKNFGDREAALYEQIEKLTLKIESHEEQKKQLRKAQENQVKQLKTKAGFDKIENKMKEQIIQKVQFYESKERDIKKYYENLISSSLASHHSEKQQVLLFYNKEIYDLKEKSAQILLSIIKVIFEVQPALAEEHPYDFSLSEEEKGNLIERGIRSLGQIIQQKIFQIGKMKEHLLVFEKSIEAELRDRKDQIEREREQFMQKQTQQHSKALKLFEEQTFKLEEDFELKKRKLEKDNRAFSQILYEQFKLLSSTHEKEYRKLFRRYDQLQRIHETRPSRAIDIARIKQLQSTVKKLRAEAQSSKKKIEYANQIMKYMNMELENYKQTYDVFGPGGESPINNTFSFNSDQKMLKIKRSLLRKMKDDYIGNLSKNAKLQVKVTPFFEERKEEKPTQAYQANLLPHSRINSDELINKNRKYSEDNEDYKDSESQESKQSQRKRSKQGHRRILKTEEKLAVKQTKILESSESLLQVLSSKNSKLISGDRSLGMTQKFSYRKKKIKRLSSEVEQLD